MGTIDTSYIEVLLTTKCQREPIIKFERLRSFLPKYGQNPQVSGSLRGQSTEQEDQETYRRAKTKHCLRNGCHRLMRRGIETPKLTS